MKRLATPVVVGALLALTSATDASSVSNAGQFMGTYTTGEIKGIYAYRYDAASGEMSSLGLVAITVNPSFAAVDARRNILYSVNEIDNYEGRASGGVSAFAIDPQAGKLTFLNEVPSGGMDPCYIALDKTGKFVFVANYGGGSVAVFGIQADGRLGEPTALVQHAPSDHKSRASQPHAHWIDVAPDNRYAVAVDLGLDELLVYHFDAAKGSLSPNEHAVVAIQAGSGPRHLAFHPNAKLAYLLNEIKSSVSVFSYEAERGVLRRFQTLSTLPAHYVGSNATAEIAVHPNGKFVYVSNRGHDSIVIFAVNAADGTLQLVQDEPTGGKTPRSFEIDPTGTRLFVANQDSGNIVVFQIDFDTGRLTPTGQVLTVPSPVSIKFVAVGRS